MPQTNPIPLPVKVIPWTGPEGVHLKDYSDGQLQYMVGTKDHYFVAPCSAEMANHIADLLNLGVTAEEVKELVGYARATVEGTATSLCASNALAPFEEVK